MNDLFRLFPDLPYAPRRSAEAGVREVRRKAVIAQERIREAVAMRKRLAEQIRFKFEITREARRSLLKDRIHIAIRRDAWRQG